MQVTYTALGGLQQAEDQVNRTASLLARSPFSTGAPQDEVSLSDAAVSLIEAKNSYSANLDSIKVADEMQKSALSLVG
jgi:flagellar hook protein FlgE